MQTFLPFPEFARCASVLDRQRLGKQRVECKQIILALTDPAYGWKHHPATKMWRGHVGQLAIYGATMCAEWLKRGYQDSLLQFFCERIQPAEPLPAWIGDERVHASHRSALLRKLPEHYQQFGWQCDTPEYYWPV